MLMLFSAGFAAASSRPSDDALAAITARGVLLAGYDAAAWQSTDAVTATHPSEGLIERYIARKTDAGWVVDFGRLNASGDKFLVAYETVQTGSPARYEVKSFTPVREDMGWNLSAAKAVELVTKDFGPTTRPYNIAVLPGDVSAKGQKEINTAYQLACSYSVDGCSSGQQATIRYVGFTYNVQIAGDVMDPSTLPDDSIKDPGITNKIFHKGAPDSFYLSSPLGLAGTNVPHVVDDPAGIEAHVDHFGPANPIHWGEAILSLFINTRAQAGGGFTQTCSPGGGCQ